MSEVSSAPETLENNSDQIPQNSEFTNPANTNRLGYLRSRFKSIMKTQDETTLRFKDPKEDPFGLRVKRARQQFELEQAAQIDKKTGLVADATFKEEERRITGLIDRDPNVPTVIGIMMDIDNFKAFNSDFGQEAGDEALTEVGAAILSTIRDTDIGGRIGGEELAILAPKTSNPNSAGSHREHPLAEEVRIRISQLELKTGRPVTVSVGVAEYKRGEGINSFRQRLNSAEIVAKRAGKNRVVESFLHNDIPLNRDTTNGKLWQVIRDEKNEILSVDEVKIDDNGQILKIYSETKQEPTEKKIT